VSSPPNRSRHCTGPVRQTLASRGNSRTLSFPLMIALSMVMLDVFADAAPQGALAKEDDPHSSFTDLTQRSA